MGVRGDRDLRDRADSGLSFVSDRRATGFEPETLPGSRPGDALPDVVLDRYSAVRGVLLAPDSRIPVTFHVELINKAKREALWNSTNIRQSRFGTEGELRFSDAQGRYLYDGLRPGEYVAIFSARGHLTAVRDIVLQAGEELALDVVLDRGARAEGVVLDEESGEIPWLQRQLFFLRENSLHAAPLYGHLLFRGVECKDCHTLDLEFILRCRFEGDCS